MDVSTISTIFSTVKTATDIAKLLRESGISLEKAETKLKLAELIEALAEVKMQLADVRELLLEKDDEIRKLQEEMKIKGSMVFEQPYYWLETVEGKVGPFCQACFDGEKKLSRLHDYGDGFWRCRVCGKNFDKKDLRQHDRGDKWEAFT